PKSVRGYAHVIKEDLIKPDLLFLGTEFGLWVSIDGGKNWAQFKGNHFPAVAVRDLAIQPRDNELVLATHGRGIWIIDDITPLRALTPDLLKQDVAFVSARAVQPRIEGRGGWAHGDDGRYGVSRECLGLLSSAGHIRVRRLEGDGWVGGGPALFFLAMTAP